MTKSDKNKLIEWASTRTDKELERAYYETVFDSLGSETEEMYERGYDMADIIEREKYEKLLGEQADLLGRLCEERGIKLWE